MTTNPITINGRPMRLIWGSNAPWTPGGYGVTTTLVVPRLRDRLGIDVAISATYGHAGGKLTWRGIDVYPYGATPFGNDIHSANAKQHRADILLTHQDVWTQQPEQITAGGTRWVSWQPLDSEPVAPIIVGRLRDYCYQPLALSRFGAEQATLAGLPMPTVLQGIDTNVFVPGDRSAARDALGWPKDAFIVGMVARNSGYPNRKAYPQQLEAFAQFAKHHPDALLYLHAFTDMAADPEATPILWQLEQCGLLGRLIPANNYDLNLGYSTEQMVLRYQAMDVLLQVSMSEGCGIPLLEAQSCGIPVITGAWTAMEENCRAGWLVAREDSDPWPVSPLHCYWRLPHIGAIAEHLEEAYRDAHSFYPPIMHATIVAHHDQDMLIDTQWRDALEAIARRIEAEAIPWHVHKWGVIGTATEAGVIVPCQVPDCPAEMRANGTHDVYDDGAPVIVDGIALDLADDPNGGVKHQIASEIVRSYHLHELTFEAGDVAIDIGAHVGVVSCYLAKKWPELTIYAYEPAPANYARLVRNIEANSLTNVRVFNRAVTDDGRDLALSGDPQMNTGSYSAFKGEQPVGAVARSTTLQDILREQRISRVALLKVDCEGAEYEILYCAAAELARVDALAMEIHENKPLVAQHGDGLRLLAFARAHIPWTRISVIQIPDPEVEIIEAEQIRSIGTRHSITSDRIEGAPSCLSQ